MRVLLQRTLFAEGNRYRVQSGGTEVPDTIELPPGAKIWNGTEFVDVPETKSERDALIKRSVHVADEADEQEKEEVRKRIDEDPRLLMPYDPRVKSPNSREPTQGAMPLSGEDRKAEEEREKKERYLEEARMEFEKERMAAEAKKDVAAEESADKKAEAAAKKDAKPPVKN